MGKGNRVSGARVLSLAAQMRPFFSLLPLEGGALKGRRLAACNGTPTFAEANPASLRSSAPSRGRGANDFYFYSDSIVVIRGQGLALPPTYAALFRFLHLSFIPPVPYPPLRGTFPSRGRLAIRGKPAINRPSGIAPYIHGEAASFIPHSNPFPPLKIFLDFPSPKVYSSFNFIKAVKRRVHEGRWQRELHPVRRSADESMEDGL